MKDDDLLKNIVIFGTSVTALEKKLIENPTKIIFFENQSRVLL